MASSNPPPIPGIDMLGRGFNPFDPNASELGSTAFRSSLIDYDYVSQPYQGDSGGNWVVPPGSGDPDTGETFAVPADVSVTGLWTSNASTETFLSYNAVSSYFSGQAGASGTDGLFSGSAEANFAVSDQSSASYFYGLCETLTQRWSLNLDNAILFNPTKTNGSSLDATFSAAANALPSAFDPTDSSVVQQFQSFFTDYGTHIVGTVYVGSRSRLSVAIQRSSNITTANASLDIKAEYTVDTGTLGTQAKYQDSNYLSNRTTRFFTIGGDPTLAAIAGSDPAGSADNGTTTNYLNWLASTGANPATIQVNLIAMWQLGAFSASQQAALQQAFNYFSLPNSAIPMYFFQGGYSNDFLFTTLENPEFSHFGSYSYQDIDCYVLPQTTTNPQAITLQRYYNGSYHYYTVDYQVDQSQNPPVPYDGGYTEDTEYAIKVLPASGYTPCAGSPQAMYRYITQNHGYYVCNGSNTPPPDVSNPLVQNPNGAYFTSFPNPPVDPFSQASVATARVRRVAEPVAV